MKNFLLIFFAIICIVPSLTIAKEQTEINCPKPEMLLLPTESDREKLIIALNELIPKFYSTKPEYEEWNIEVIKPIWSLTGDNEGYYEMAKHFCGREVANRSWFVRLRFSRLFPAQSASLGEIYVAKDKQDNWIVWFQYH